MYQVDWTPSFDRVAGTLSPIFREQYRSTFAIIEASEVFIETPTDLCMQSSTCKHHNTAKFFIACTPNGCVCFVSPLFISGVELTPISGFLSSLPNTPLWQTEDSLSRTC